MCLFLSRIKHLELNMLPISTRMHSDCIVTFVIHPTPCSENADLTTKK